MDAFETSLKRAFAEAPEPAADDGFVVTVAAKVSRRENFVTLSSYAQVAGLAIAAIAISVALFSALMGVAPQLQAALGLELARAHGALGGAAEASSQLSGFNFNLMAMGQSFFILAALAGGGLIYRTSRLN